jgi:hypothetical protein
MSTVIFLAICFLALRLMVYALVQFGKHARVPGPRRLRRAGRVSGGNETAHRPVTPITSPKGYTVDDWTRRRAS